MAYTRRKAFKHCSSHEQGILAFTLFSYFESVHHLLEEGCRVRGGLLGAGHVIDNAHQGSCVICIRGTLLARDHSGIVKNEAILLILGSRCDLDTDFKSILTRLLFQIVFICGCECLDLFCWYKPSAWDAHEGIVILHAHISFLHARIFQRKITRMR